MVEKIKANGAYSRDVLQELGRDSSKFSNTRFYYEPHWRAKLHDSLEMVRNNSKVDEVSILIERARDTTSIFDVLSIPAGEILLPQLYPDIVGFPPANSTYLVRGFNRFRDEVKDVLILTIANEDVATIAGRKFRDSGWWRRDFSMQVNSVKPEEFIELLKEKIDNGEEVDARLLQYSNMRKYYEMKFIERKREKNKQ